MKIIVVVYQPSEEFPTSGPILYQVKGTKERIKALTQPYVRVFEDKNDWDVTHYVDEGEVCFISPVWLEAHAENMARIQMRVLRDNLLRDHVDPIILNRVRWDEMSAEKQAEWTTYRRALLDWPQTETNYLSPTPPTEPTK